MSPAVSSQCQWLFATDFQLQVFLCCYAVAGTQNVTNTGDELLSPCQQLKQPHIAIDVIVVDVIKVGEFALN